ncbi:MAG: hypothetical protein NVSMB27_29280 [Ktedonobacteraceae bacterium]
MPNEHKLTEAERVSPTDTTVADIPVPSWPPAQQSFRRRETFPIALTMLIILLALALVGSSFGFIVYATTLQYRATLRTQATTIVNLTRQAQGTVQARTQATVNAWATANARIYASATAQAALTAQVDNGTATTTAFNDIFTRDTGGTPKLVDSLSDNSGNNNWDETSGSVDGACVFTGGDYHALEARQGYFQPCLAEATNFRNFVYQVTMIIDSGRQGGIIFRANSTQGSFYFFRIGIDGTYALDLYKSGNQEITLIHGFSSAITTGLTQTNQLAVIANAGNLYLYANQQFLTSVSDSSLSSGKIGVVALDLRNPSEVEYSNAQVWNIPSGA